MEDTELYAKEWAKMVYENGVTFKNWEEMADSLVAYLKGEEHPSHVYATK